MTTAITILAALVAVLLISAWRERWHNAYTKMIVTHERHLGNCASDCNREILRLIREIDDIHELRAAVRAVHSRYLAALTVPPRVP